MNDTNANWLTRPQASDIPGDPARQRIGADELRRLSARSDQAGLTRLVIHLACLFATGAALWWLRGTMWMFPLVLLHGYVLAFLFCAQHEATHRTAFASRSINDWVGHAVGFALLLPHNAFRAFHWDHHRYTQDLAHDPELANGLPDSRAALLWLWFGVPNWLNRISTFFRHGVLGTVRAPWIPEAQHRAVVLEARLYLLGYAALFGLSVYWQTMALVWLWLLPVFCGYWFLRPYLLCEHTGCPIGGDQRHRSRTTFTNPVTKLFAWNMPFHTEHHAYPGVPFHALPQLHRLMSDQLVNTQPGYLAGFRDILSELPKSDNRKPER